MENNDTLKDTIDTLYNIAKENIEIRKKCKT